MNQIIRVNKILILVSVFSALLFLMTTAALFSVSNWVFGILTLAMSLFFVLMAFRNAQRIEINETGIVRSGLFTEKKVMRWEEIREIGVTGTKVFNQNHKNRTGALYIYVSPVKMNDDERFQMILDWPPKDKIYFIYGPERIQEIQMFYTGRIVTYNTGDLML